jgi:hypothetical protein
MSTGFQTNHLRSESGQGLVSGVSVVVPVYRSEAILPELVRRAIFSGAQLFALGMIGEYLARMHFRMMDRPCYAIREIIGTPGNEGTT